MKIAEFADSKKAVGTEILDISKLSSFTDHMVLTSGESGPQIRAICGAIDDGLEKLGYKKLRWEGTPASNWMILDLSSVVVHVMSPEERGRYKLEELWGRTAVTYHL